MKIAIISDSHDHIEKLTKALGVCRELKVEQIIHCGDVVAASVMHWLSQNFEGYIHYVFGNNEDRYLMTKLIETQLKPLVVMYGDRGEVILDKVNFAFNHYPEVASGQAAEGKYDVVCFGHTHRASQETRHHTLLINPGTLAGLFAPATFMIYDTETRAVQIIQL